jgi:hypothetical protein
MPFWGTVSFEQQLSAVVPPPHPLPPDASTRSQARPTTPGRGFYAPCTLQAPRAACWYDAPWSVCGHGHSV